MKGEINIVEQVNHLKTIIRRIEDTLICEKSQYEIEKLQRILRVRRIELQKLERQARERGVLLQVPLFFSRKMQVIL